MKNSKSSIETKSTTNFINNLIAATIVTLMVAAKINASDAAIAGSRELKTHNPYTVTGISSARGWSRRRRPTRTRRRW
jgi:hypothetical protein